MLLLNSYWSSFVSRIFPSTEKSDKLMGKLKVENGLEPVGYDEEVYVNEAYESMSPKSQGIFLLLCYVIYICFAICCFLLPSRNLEEIKPLPMKKNVTNLAINIIDAEEKYYQPYLRLFLESNSSIKEERILRSEYEFDVFRGIILFSSTTQPKQNIKLDSGQKKIKIFELLDFEASKVMLKGHLTLLSCSPFGLQLKWQKFNDAYGYFVFFIFFVLFIVLSVVMLLLIRAFKSMKYRVPTSANKSIFMFLIFIIIATAPVPELSFFDIFYLGRLSAPYLTAIYKALFIACAETICWNLYFRDDESEILLYRASYIYTPLLIFILIIPNLFSINITLFNRFLLALMICLILSLIAVPFLIDPKSEEFTTSFVHVLIVLPAYVMMCVGIYFNFDRYNRFELLNRMIIPVSTMFLALIRWPFEDLVIELEGKDDFQPDEDKTSDDTEEESL